MTLTKQLQQLGQLVHQKVFKPIRREVEGRKDLENKIMKQVDETCFALRLDLAREKKLREEAEERHEKEVADEIIRIADSIDQERKNRLDGVHPQPRPPCVNCLSHAVREGACLAACVVHASVADVCPSQARRLSCVSSRTMSP